MMVEREILIDCAFNLSNTLLMYFKHIVGNKMH